MLEFRKAEEDQEKYLRSSHLAYEKGLNDFLSAEKEYKKSRAGKRTNAP